MTAALGGVQRSFEVVAGLSGWRRRGLALLLGAVAAGALPPFHLVFLLIPAFSGLVWLIASASGGRRAFMDAWWFGIGHGAAGTFWIAHSLTIDIASHGWLIPIAVIGFAAVLGLFAAIAGWLHFLLRRPGTLPSGADALILAGVWTGTEWLRSWLFTGFPWNLMGTVWTFADAMVQPAALFGVFGLSLITVAATAAPAALAGRSRRPWLSSAFALAFLGGVWGGGAYHLYDAETVFAPGVHLRLVQPNIAQADKWRKSRRPTHVARQIDMSMMAAEKAPDGQPGPEPTHVIWAETAVPYVLGREPALIRALAHAAPQEGALLTGSLRIEADPRSPDNRPQVFNSFYVLEASGRIAATYDKHHLVPFGEYVPFQEVLGFLKITEGRGNFSAGPGPRVLEVQGLPPFTPLICYEIIFPAAVIPKTGDGPDGGKGDAPAPRARWMLNITNDAWFGVTPGPYQHLAAARLRAVEEGVPVVRVANTGISAVIDPWGRIVASLGLDRAGTVDAPLPEPIEQRTVFARLGNGPALLLALLLALIGWVSARRAAPPV